MSELKGSQINYSQAMLHAPKYRYLRVPMSNIQSSSVTVGATTTTNVEFKLPYNTVMNLSKSKLSCAMSLAAETTNLSNVIADAYPFFGQVSLETTNGLRMVDLPYSTKYSKIVGKACTSFSDFMTRGRCDFLDPCKTLGTSNYIANVAGSVDYLEPNYYHQSAAATAQKIQMSYELGNFKETILALDKDTYFGNNEIVLKLTIDNVDKWAFDSVLAVGSSAGATLTTALTSLTSFYLYLAVETNPIIVDSVRQKFDTEGIKLVISYPITNQASAASASQNRVINYTPAHGHHLKSIWHSVWDNTEAFSTSVDCNNTNGAKIESFNTYLDNDKLQTDLVDCKNTTNNSADSWRLVQPICKNTPILNQDVFMKNWFHADVFTNVDALKDPKLNDNTVDGIEMKNGLMYQFVATAVSATYSHMTFAIFQRNLSISKDGIQFI